MIRDKHSDLLSDNTGDLDLRTSFPGSDAIPATQPSRIPSHKSIVAPWWNVSLVIVLIAATSLFGSMRTSRTTMAAHHLPNDAVTIAWEWALAGIALWGLRINKTPLREVLGEKRRGVREFFVDLGVAAVFWLFSSLVLAALALFLRLFHIESAQKQIGQLAPATLAEGVLWIALSVSAGICEEFLFRGYLQLQFSRATGRTWTGVLISSVLFGCAHGYEGPAGMLMIAAFGALFSMLALRRKSLRAGMIAHAWHDGFTGIVLALLNRAHVPLGTA